MSIATIAERIEGDVKTEIESLVAKGEELIAHGKTILETHLPSIITDVQKAEADASAIAAEPFVKAYIGNGLAVPEHLVNIGLDFLSKLVSAWEEKPATATAGAADDGPAGIDAEPDAA